MNIDKLYHVTFLEGTINFGQCIIEADNELEANYEASEMIPRVIAWDRALEEYSVAEGNEDDCRAIVQPLSFHIEALQAATQNINALAGAE